MIKKYKVWDKNKGEWNKSLLLSQDGEIIDIAVSGEGCITNIAKNDNDYEIFFSTGLTDKNGVEIYEGDIVRVVEENLYYDKDDGDSIPYIYNYNNFVVKWSCDKDQFYPAFELYDYDGDTFDNNGNSFSQILNNCDTKLELEIIGHIKTHPELLNR